MSIKDHVIISIQVIFHILWRAVLGFIALLALLIANNK